MSSTAVPGTRPSPVAALLGLGLSATTLATLYLVAVCTARGQWWDERVWWALSARSPLSHQEVGAVLRQLVTPATCVLALVAIALLAVAQRRLLPALVGIGCAAGTFISAEALKALLVRPDLGISEITSNSFPSGHTGAVAAIAVAAVVALARAGRLVVTALAVAATLATGLGVVIAGWHRPSDPVASTLVAVVWALVGLLLVQGHDRR